MLLTIVYVLTCRDNRPGRRAVLRRPGDSGRLLVLRRFARISISLVRSLRPRMREEKDQNMSTEDARYLTMLRP